MIKSVKSKNQYKSVIQTMGADAGFVSESK